MKIEISKKTASCIWTLYDRYYSSSFKRAGLAKDDNEEEDIINAIFAIVKEIKEIKDNEK